MITITAKRILYSQFGEQGKVVSSDKLHLYAWEPISIKGGVTLHRLLSLVIDNLDIWQLLLQEDIRPFLVELDKPITRTTPIEWFEVFWEAIVDNIDDDKDFEMAPNICGKKTGTDELQDPSEFGIGLTPLNNIAHLPLKLNTKVNIKVLTYKNDNIATEMLEFGDRDFTVLEFFKTLFMEIAFFGTPQQREQQLQALAESLKQAKEGRVASWQEVKQRIEEKIKRRNTLGLLGENNDSN